METEGLNLPGFGWAAPKCGRGCDCTDKEKRPPGDHVDSPPEAATTAAPDGSSSGSVPGPPVIEPSGPRVARALVKAAGALSAAASPSQLSSGIHTIEPPIFATYLRACMHEIISGT